MQKTKRLMLAFVMVILAAIATNEAFAQTNSNPQDSNVIIVVIAGVLGAATAPVILWATKESTPGADGKLPNDPFDKKQYILALVIGIPSVTGLLITEISGLNATVSGLGGTIILFLMAFVQGLGVDIGKSRIGQAIKNP